MKTLQPIQKQIITKSTYTPSEIGRLIASKIEEKYERLIPGNVLNSSIITDRYSSSIRNINIYNEGKNSKPERFQYQVEITLDTSDNLGYSIYWNRKDLDNTKVFDLIDGIKAPLAIEELRKGDQIMIEVTLDLLKNPKDNVLNNTIIRVKKKK